MANSFKFVLSSFIFAILFNIANSTDPRRTGKPSATPGPDLFVKGRYLEYAVNPSGGFGSREVTVGLPYGGSPVPEDFHPSPSVSQLGVVVDDGLDGWDVGTPSQVNIWLFVF